MRIPIGILVGIVVFQLFLSLFSSHETKHSSHEDTNNDELLFCSKFDSCKSNKTDLVINMIQDIPDIAMYPLNFVFEVMKLRQKPNTMWLEFGVYVGNSINYISQFANFIYGFDSFLGLPEAWREGYGQFSLSLEGNLPSVRQNVGLVKGWFNETLPLFLRDYREKISFIHIDCDLYSSTKIILDNVKNRLDKDCIIVFDELVNYPGFEFGELQAFYEFVTENDVSYEWIGMDGTPTGMRGYEHENVAVLIHAVNDVNVKLQRLEKKLDEVLRYLSKG